MSLFPKARPTYWRNPQVTRRIDTHAFAESGQYDHRGMPICEHCGHLSTSPVHVLPPTHESAAEIDRRRLGESDE